MSGRNARAGLSFLDQGQPDREGRDRLEILTTLIAGPSFDPIFRPDMIEIPRQHPIYRWECVIGGCERSRSGGTDLCSEHLQQFARERGHGFGKAAFLTATTGLKRHARAEEMAAACVRSARLRIPSCGCATVIYADGSTIRRQTGKTRTWPRG